MRWVFLTCVAAVAWASPVSAAAAEEAAVFWASDPVYPGEAAVVIGSGFGDKPRVELARVPDGPPAAAAPATFAWPAGGQVVEALQACDQSVKFVIPEKMRAGVLAFRITPGGAFPAGPGTRPAGGKPPAPPAAAVIGVLNRPQAWWAQGDLGTAASPGGQVRVFGTCLAGFTSPAVRLTGPRTVTLPAMADDDFALRAALPKDLPAGQYQLSAHHGLGGAGAWSQPVPLVVAPPPPAWPVQVYDVRQFGAVGDGAKDDTAAVQAALDKAKSAGGGVVYFPRGRYRLSDGLAVPTRCVLRGQKRDLSALAWADMPSPPEALVRGTNTFGVEDLTLYARNHRHVIAGDLGDQPGAGNVFLRRLCVRADAYRGHLTPEEVDQRLRDSLRLSTGGGDTVRLGGANIEIVDCDLYGTGRALFLSRTRGGRVADNRFYNGRWGWYCISGSDGLIFEHNTITGADLMSTGGGLNCLDGSNYSQNVYFARNRLSLLHGWDREAMTSDAGGEAYFGHAEAAEGAQLTLAGEPNWRKRDWAGAGAFILAGRGAGQVRRVTATDGRTVRIDRPWAVAPDAASDVCVTMFQGRYLLVSNDFTDTGSVQFYGTSVQCVVARNRGTRMGGFRSLGLWYDGYQPSWFCQFIGNEIAEGNYYHFDSAAEAELEIAGQGHAPYAGPMNRGAVLRGNRLLSNAHVQVTGACRDVLVEHNLVRAADVGVFVSEKAAGVLLRENQFDNVTHDTLDEPALRKAAEERLKRFMGCKDPVAVWSFDAMAGGKFIDGSGNGFFATPVGGAKQGDGGLAGKCVQFDGTGYLRVDEPAVFNAPDVTVSLWVRPGSLTGRRGIIAKRWGGAGPLVLSQNNAAVAFEAAEDGGPWTFNFSTPDVLKLDTWTHLAAVARTGEGVTLYVNGKCVAEKKNPARRQTNAEPLFLGRDAWGGQPPKGDTPGLFIGRLDEVRIWTRALSAEEIQSLASGPQTLPSQPGK